TTTVTVSNVAPPAADTIPPAAPSNFAATSANSKVTLSWTDPTDADLKSIRVLLLRGEATTLRGTVDKALQTYTDISSDLIAGLPFTYALEAEDTSGNLSARATVTVTVVGGAAVVDTTPPATPSNPTATSADGKVTLAWTDPTDVDFSTVRILLVQGAATTLRGTVAKGVKTYTDTGADLIVGTAYTYKLEAEDTSGNRSSRATVTVTVVGGPAVADTSPPASPTVLEATSTDRAVTLTWKDSADADLGTIRVLLVRGAATTVRGTVAKGVQKYVDTGSDLVAGATLTYKLEAEDVSGNRSTPVSVTVTVATEPPPPPPPPTVDELVRASAPCRALLSVTIRGHLIDAFSRTQGRALTSPRDLLFLCSLLTDPTHPTDPTKLYPEYRDEQAEVLALKNFVNFFGRPPSKDTRKRLLPVEAGDRDWWAVKYMAYHLRLLPTARDLDGERTCLKLFLARDVDLYKDGVKARKAKGAPPKDLFDYDFIRACTYSGVKFVQK
ncbi:MAG: hypothetical protein Q7R80_00870, partial [bacterium]|nr:hypothetical protein [bacterium]